MSESLGVYISVPFCKAKCTFCNFASGAFAPNRMDQYVQRVCQEIGAAPAWTASLGADLPRSIDTVYLGGGTPSLLSASQVGQLFTKLREEFVIAPCAEITLECAPGQLSGETLQELQNQGINRVSLGVQSFVDKESSAIGRLHTEQLCVDEIARLRSSGISDINIDLIAGLPHQTHDSWLYSLDAVIAAAAPHVSVYMLEVDDQSRLGREILAAGPRYGAAAIPSEDQCAEWYQLACERLHASHIEQYEISNFAREGHQSRHNLKYWKRHPYLGFGLDAHSMLHVPAGDVRWANTSDLDLYSGDAEPEKSALPLYSPLASSGILPTAEIDRVTKTQAFEESMFLGLRLNAGIALDTLRQQFGNAMLARAIPALLEVQDAGLLKWSDDNIALTDRGRIVSNEVFSRLLLSDHPEVELIAS